MADTVYDPGLGHAVVVRVLVSNRTNEKGAHKLAGQTLGKIDPDVLAPTSHAWAVIRVRIGTDGNSRCSQDGEIVDGVSHIAQTQPRLVFGSQGLVVRSVNESIVTLRPGHFARCCVGLGRDRRRL